MIDNLNARINAWWAMVLVIGFAFWLGQAAVILLFYGVSFYALREFITLTPTRRSDYPALVAAFYFVLPMQYLLIYIDWYSMFSIFIPVYVFLLLPILASLGGDTKHFLERASKVQWGLMLAVFCISFVPALLTLDIPGFEGRNLLLIAYLVIVVQLSDVMQYICGKLFGKRKIAPNLSPSTAWKPRARRPWRRSSSTKTWNRCSTWSRPCASATSSSTATSTASAIPPPRWPVRRIVCKARCTSVARSISTWRRRFPR